MKFKEWYNLSPSPYSTVWCKWDWMVLALLIGAIAGVCILLGDV